MRDDNHSRNYPPHDPYRRQSAGAGNPQGGDPLAELARLIGQNDPFSDFARDQGQGHGRRRRLSIRAALIPHRPTGPRSRLRLTRNRRRLIAMRRKAVRRSRTAGVSPNRIMVMRKALRRMTTIGPLPKSIISPIRSATRRRPTRNSRRAMIGNMRRENLHRESRARPRNKTADRISTRNNLPIRVMPRLHTPTRAAMAISSRATSSRATSRKVIRRMQPAQGQQGYGSDPYYRGMPHDEDIYEDQPRARRRGGLLTVMAVLALAVVGTAGAFGYRTLFSGSGSVLTPPTIRADAGPNKVVPTSQTTDPSGKAIYDRVGEKSQAERVVSREEQPVDLKNATPPPRVVLSSGMANPVAPVPNTPVPPAATPFASPSSPAAARPAMHRPNRKRSAPSRSAPISQPLNQRPRHR